MTKGNPVLGFFGIFFELLLVFILSRIHLRVGETEIISLSKS